MLSEDSKYQPFRPPTAETLSQLYHQFFPDALVDDPSKLGEKLREPLSTRLECLLVPTWYETVWKVLHTQKQRSSSERVRLEEALGWTRITRTWPARTQKRPSRYVWKSVDEAGRSVLLGALEIPPTGYGAGNAAWFRWNAEPKEWNESEWRQPGTVIWERRHSAMATILSRQIALDLIKGTFRHWTAMQRMGSGLKHPPSDPLQRAIRTEELSKLCEEYRTACNEFLQPTNNLNDQNHAEERIAECIRKIVGDEEKGIAGNSNASDWYQARRLDNHLDCWLRMKSRYSLNSFLSILLCGHPVPFQTAMLGGLNEARKRMLLPLVEYDAKEGVFEEIVAGFAVRCNGKTEGSISTKERCGHIRSSTHCHRKQCNGGPTSKVDFWMFGSEGFQETSVFRCKACGEQHGIDGGSYEFVDSKDVPCPRCGKKEWGQRPVFVLTHRHSEELNHEQVESTPAPPSNSYCIADYAANEDLHPDTRDFLVALVDFLDHVGTEDHRSDMAKGQPRARVSRFAKSYSGKLQAIHDDLISNELYEVARVVTSVQEHLAASE